jgi:small subunit ribosomal protein S17
LAHLTDIAIPERSPRKVGLVESDKRDKTRKVSITFLVKHTKYGKYMRRRTVLHVHDEKNESHEGDRVEIAECRPISKTKNWVVTRIVEKASAAKAAEAAAVAAEEAEKAEAAETTGEDAAS